MLSHGDYMSFKAMLNDFDFSHLTDFSAATHVRNSHELGIFFTFFVLLQFWNIFNARYFRTGRSLIEDLIDMVKHPSSISRHYSTGFVSIIFVILIGQIMITNVFGEMFGVEALSFKDWLFLFVTTSPVLLIGDTLRLLKNKIS